MIAVQVLARATHVGERSCTGHAMSRGAPSDLANELNGVGELLLSLTANGADRDGQLTKLFVSFNARVSKLPHGTPENVMDEITDAIGSGPWTDRQKEALLALIDTVTLAPPRAEEKSFQHALRRTMYEPPTHAACASRARDTVLHYTTANIRTRAVLAPQVRSLRHAGGVGQATEETRRPRSVWHTPVATACAAHHTPHITSQRAMLARDDTIHDAGNARM